MSGITRNWTQWRRRFDLRHWTLSWNVFERLAQEWTTGNVNYYSFSDTSDLHPRLHLRRKYSKLERKMHYSSINKLDVSFLKTCSIRTLNCMCTQPKWNSIRRVQNNVNVVTSNTPNYWILPSHICSDNTLALQLDVIWYIFIGLYFQTLMQSCLLVCFDYPLIQQTV